MGTESDPSEEEETHVFCFHHLMILEFVAAKYAATLDKVIYPQTCLFIFRFEILIIYYFSEIILVK